MNKKILMCLLMVMLLACNCFAKSKIEASNKNYILAILPVVDTSGLDQRIMEGISNAIQDALKKKYPPNKTKVRFVNAEAIAQVMASQPFENTESPTLKEMLKVGELLGADRVMYLGMMSVSDKESGFMVVVGSGTIRANVTMKQKLVDVKKGKYIYNANTMAKGSSSSVNFWRIGSPSKIRAIKKGVEEAMVTFLSSFDQEDKLDKDDVKYLDSM